LNHLVARRFGQAEFALAHDRVDPGDLAPDDLQPPVVVQLAGGALDAQVEQLRLGFAQLDHQILVGQLAQFGGTGAGCHQTSTPSRLTMRHFIGSLWIARRIASRAICSFGKDISKRIRPGLMLATHHSGEPLPEPIRVSAGFLVIAWSGNTVIQTLPPRRMCRVMAIRAASICRLVRYAGSSAWMPNSPNATRVPPFAEPCRSGWCGLRKPFGGLRGISIGQPSCCSTGAAAAAPASVPTLVGSATTARPASVPPAVVPDEPERSRRGRSGRSDRSRRGRGGPDSAGAARPGTASPL